VPSQRRHRTALIAPLVRRNVGKRKRMKTSILFMTVTVMAVIANAEMPTFPFVFVEGYAKKDVAPNMAQINFNLEMRCAGASEAMSAIDDQSKVILKYLYDQQISPKDIIAHRIEKEALQNEEKGAARKVVGYKASRHFSITVNNLSRYVDIAQTIFSNTNIVWASTDFGASNKVEIEAELLMQASQNAKEKAVQMAKGFGGKLGPVHAITQRDFYNIAGAFGVGPEEGGGRSISFESHLEGLEGVAEEHRVLYVPASITFNNGVMAIFRMEPDTK